MKNILSPYDPAPSITRAASKQTYYTIRFLVDRERVADAYRAYAYFRWVDDTLDSGEFALSGVSRQPNAGEARERYIFLERQKSLLEACYRGESFPDATPEEQMLIELVRRDHTKDSGLHSYLHHMMQVMEFDARRRGRLISQAELNEYTRWLATAVTEAMHYFIGHDHDSPQDGTRYLAVTAAHITHMLRDTFDDAQAGYYNIPREVLEAHYIRAQAVHSRPYRAWVRSRVQLARHYFQEGRRYLARVEHPRCRLAGFAYTARFEWLLDTIEQEHYFLRPAYGERKRPGAGVRMALSTLGSLFQMGEKETLTQPVVPPVLREL